MAKQQQQSSSSSDSSMDIVWIGVFVAIVGFSVWYFGHASIVAFIFKINVWQAQLVQLFVPGTPLANQIYYMQTVDPGSVTWGQLVQITAQIGDYIRYPVIIIAFILGGILYHSDITLKYRKLHDMRTLRAQEQVNWPSIVPVVKLDLTNEDINVGPWAMAMTPMEFAKKNNLLKKNDALLDNPIPGDEMTASIRRGDAKRIFTLQLGAAWNGFEHCAPHVKALAAVFLARINRDRASATHILETIDKASGLSAKIDFSVAYPTLKKYQDTELAQEVFSKHAYQLTVLASLLEASRDDGVVPSAEFLWLKPFDRRLWFMLNCVGRQTPFVEVGGPFAHWKAEKAMGRRTLVPMIDEAIKALDVAIKEVKLSPKVLAELTL